MLEMQGEESDGESSDDGIDALNAKLEKAGFKEATLKKKYDKKVEYSQLK